MATVDIRFGGAMGGGAPVYAPGTTATQTIASTASSQVTTITAAAGDYLRITADGGKIRFAIGSAPTARANSGDWVADQQTVDVGPLSDGDKVAIIDYSAT